MHINSVTGFTYIGDFELNQDPNVLRSLNFVYAKGLKNKYLTANNGLVYLLTSNGIIMKIGGSGANGGIKSTLSFYLNGNTGTPGINRFGINRLIQEELRKQEELIKQEELEIQEEIKSGKKVSCYIRLVPKVEQPVFGLDGSYLVREVSVDYKPYENLCLEHYKTSEGKLPPWNFQEKGEEWPAEIKEQHRIHKAEKKKKAEVK